LELKQDALSKLEGLEKERAEQSLRSWQVRWIRYLVVTRQYVPAGDGIASLSKQTRETEATALVPLELQVAAQIGNLDSTIDGYRADRQSAPAPEVLRAAARQLFEAGDKQSARKVLEFVFARELEEHKLVAANFLGLAEIRIAAGDTPGAVELLRRLVVVVGNPFENLDPAAALLEKTGHNAEAIEFLEQLAKSAPWEASYRLRLAKATITAGKNANSAQDVVVSIASSPEVPYTVRTQAALTLVGVHHQLEHGQVESGSQELNLLASGINGSSASAADQPFFYEARLKAAQDVAEQRGKVQLLGHALADTPAPDDARVPLFLALAAAQSDEFACGVIQPLLGRQYLSRVTPTPVAEDEAVTSGLGSEDDDAASALPRSPLLASAQQFQVALTLADVLIRMERLDEALPYLQIAHKLEKVPVRRQQIAARIGDVRLQLRRRRLNVARQPILHEALEQDRLVRPKLLARAAPPANVAPKRAVKP